MRVHSGEVEFGLIRSHDCEPPLGDSDVLEFCKQGFLILPGVVPDEINGRTLDYLESGRARRPSEPAELLAEDWFVDRVLLAPAVAGAVRSLLGRDFGLPVLVSNHRLQAPAPRQYWHRDGASQVGPALNYLQVFYYPQDVPREMGPTELLPGSHFLYTLGQLPQNYMGHYGSIRGTHYTSATAGSVILTVYSIWHRRSEARGVGRRHNLKYSYFRTVAPQRDWIRADGVDFATADYGFGKPLTYRQQHRDTIDNAEMFCWLCGKGEEFGYLGGQGWPVVNSDGHHIVGPPFGVPPGLE